MINTIVSKILKFIWQLFQNWWVLLSMFILSPRNQKKNPRVFYGGALPGNRGGPRVKVKRLIEKFPNCYLDFNLVYILSSYPFLSEKTLKALKDSKIPLVLNQNGAYWPGWYGPGWKEKNRLNSLVYRKCDYVFWQSRFAREASRRFLATEDARGEVLYNAVDLNHFYPRNKNLVNKEFTFLVAGNFNSANFYQIEGAFSAFARIYSSGSYRLKVIGLSEAIRTEAELISIKMGINDGVNLLGNYSQDEGAKIIRHVDAYLALKFMDTCPNLVIEALASGVPVIFSESGGTVELVDSSCGIGVHVEGDWYSKPKTPDPALIAEAMYSIVERRIEMGEAARVHAENHFDLRYWYQRHESVFNQLLSEKV